MTKTNQDNNFKYYIDKVCPLCNNKDTCNKDCFRGYKNMKGDITIRCPYYSLNESEKEEKQWKTKK